MSEQTMKLFKILSHRHIYTCTSFFLKWITFDGLANYEFLYSLLNLLQLMNSSIYQRLLVAIFYSHADKTVPVLLNPCLKLPLITGRITFIMFSFWLNLWFHLEILLPVVHHRQGLSSYKSEHYNFCKTILYVHALKNKVLYLH